MGFPRLRPGMPEKHCRSLASKRPRDDIPEAFCVPPYLRGEKENPLTTSGFF
jgi:hypothetical protein